MEAAAWWWAGPTSRRWRLGDAMREHGAELEVTQDIVGKVCVGVSDIVGKVCVGVSDGLTAATRASTSNFWGVRRSH